MAPPASFKWRPTGRRDILNATGSGMLNVLLYGEERVKANSVVRGGHRSFLTGSHLGGPLGIQDRPGTRRAKPTIGGNLRRSWHAIVFVDGRPLPGSRTVDENGNAAPAYGVSRGVVGVLGSNTGYGEHVDQGTSKMPARPMIWPAVNDMVSAIGGLFRAGWQAYARRAGG